MFFLELLGSSYFVYAIVAVFLAYKLTPSGQRALFLKIALVTPPLMVFYAFQSIAVRQRRAGPRYNDHLAATEERIETKRVSVFGGERMTPSISAWWQTLYYSGLERTVQHGKRMAGIDSTAHLVHR